MFGVWGFGYVAKLGYSYTNNTGSARESITIKQRALRQNDITIHS